MKRRIHATAPTASSASRPVPHTGPAGAVPGLRAREARRAKHQARRILNERRRRQPIRSLGQLGSTCFPVRTVITSGFHFARRAEQRGFSYRDFLDTYGTGEWVPDADSFDEWRVRRDGWELVVLFDHETPKLKTVKAVADDEAA